MLSCWTSRKKDIDVIQNSYENNPEKTPTFSIGNIL